MPSKLKTAFTALFVAAALAACGPVEEDPITVSSSEGLTFEEWVVTLERNDRGAYMVEGDIAIYGEEKVRRYFEEEMPRPGALTVATRNGRELRWSASTKDDLTYCVSNNFGSNKQAVINAVTAAANAGEAIAEVNFVYGPSEDANCDNENTNVVFNVRSGDCGSGCNAQAFFPGDPRRERELIIDGARSAPAPRTPKES